MDLMTKTFLIVGGMLIITTIAARFNKALETKTEATIAIGDAEELFKARPGEAS